MSEYALGIDLTSLSINMAQINADAEGWEPRPFLDNVLTADTFGRLSGLTRQLLENYLDSYQQQVVYKNAAAGGSVYALNRLRQRLTRIRGNRIAFAHPVLWPIGAISELTRKVSDSFARGSDADRGDEPIPVAAPWAAALGWSLRQSDWNFPLDLLVLTSGLQGHIDLTVIHTELNDGFLRMEPQWFHSSSPNELEITPGIPALDGLRCDVAVAASKTAASGWEAYWKQQISPPRRGMVFAPLAIAEGCCFIASCSGGRNSAHSLIQRGQPTGRIPFSIGVIGGAKMNEPVWYRLCSKPGVRNTEVLHRGKVPHGLLIAAVPASRALIPQDWLLSADWGTAGVTMMDVVVPKRVDAMKPPGHLDTLNFLFDDAGIDERCWSHSQIRVEYTAAADESAQQR